MPFICDDLGSTTNIRRFTIILPKIYFFYTIKLFKLENLLHNLKIEKIQNGLINWYKLKGRNFDWRKPGLSPYNYVISEILLQRTKANKVKEIYPIFLDCFPNWEKLNRANVRDIESVLEPIGLFRQRAARLKSLAKFMVTVNGIFPEDADELRELPLMGHYISNAVLLLVYSHKLPLLDVNMARVLERVFKKRTKVDLRYDEFLNNLAKEVVNHDSSKEINWAIIDLAAMICKPTKPDCYKCPLSNFCNYNLKLNDLSSS